MAKQGWASERPGAQAAFRSTKLRPTHVLPLKYSQGWGEVLACTPGALGTHCSHLIHRTPPCTLWGQGSTLDNSAGSFHPSLELLLPPGWERPCPEAFPLRGLGFLLNCCPGRRRKLSPGTNFAIKACDFGHTPGWVMNGKGWSGSPPGPQLRLGACAGPVPEDVAWHSDTGAARACSAI